MNCSSHKCWSISFFFSLYLSLCQLHDFWCGNKKHVDNALDFDRREYPLVSWWTYIDYWKYSTCEFTKCQNDWMPSGVAIDWSTRSYVSAHTSISTLSPHTPLHRRIRNNNHKLHDAYSFLMTNKLNKYQYVRTNNCREMGECAKEHKFDELFCCCWSSCRIIKRKVLLLVLSQVNIHMRYM